MDDPIDRTGPWWFVDYRSESAAPIVESWPGDLPIGAYVSIAPGFYREHRERPGVRRQDNTGTHIRTLTFHRDPVELCRLFIGWWEVAISNDDVGINKALTELQALTRRRERDYEQLADLRKQYETFLGAHDAGAE